MPTLPPSSIFVSHWSMPPRQPISGLIRVKSGDEVVPVEGLLNRGTMLDAKHAARQWYVLVEPTTVHVPAQRLTVEAVSGLETETARFEVDLTPGTAAEVTIPITRFSDVAADGWRAGNTHLHLMNMTRAEADRYLQSIPRGDGLELVFLSYLRRFEAEERYTSNEYTRDDLDGLATPDLRFGNGEEHRHNFNTHGEGYGHVMLLNIQELIRPVSIGPGIMKTGTDGPPLARGIRQAHRDGASVVWCHNDYGLEDVPNWLAGTLDAQNIFDGSTSRDYRPTFYRYMNVGLRVPFSAGTDWFLYDFSRVYVQLADPLTVEPLTVESWLKGLAAGRTFISNGPLFEFSLDGQAAGDVIDLPHAHSLPLRGRVVGRHDFEHLQVVHNGEVVAAVDSRPVAGHFEAAIETAIPFDQPGWLALRIDSSNVNELGGQLFGHTSAVYVDIAGRSTFHEADALGLLDDMQQATETIIREARFADDAQQNEVLDVYQAGIKTLRQRLQNK
ncbi:MAG: CehA/McbA family metallohydrolase [Pirellulales bacterium]